jgi:hypothetical protein
LAAILFIAVLTGSDVPYIEEGMTSFIALAIIAVASCTANVLSTTWYGWTSSTYLTNPLSIIGMGLGVASLILIILTLVGVTEPAMAFTILGVIVFSKVGIKIWENAILK